MDAHYESIFDDIEVIEDRLHSIANDGESTCFFPVGTFVDIVELVHAFREEVQGALKKQADFNLKRNKELLNNLYGKCVTEYCDTDSVKND